MSPLAYRNPFLRLAPYMVATFLVCGLMAYAWLDRNGTQLTRTIALPEVVGPVAPNCGYTSQRMSGFSDIAPLITVEPACEAKRFGDLKQRLADRFKTLVQGGSLMDASVYLQDLGTADWMILNDESRFSPLGSMRVALMVAYYQMEEQEPGTFLRKVTYNGRIPLVPHMTHSPTSIVEVGGQYTLGDLVTASVRDNDHIATSLLVANIDRGRLTESFEQFGVPGTCVDTVVDRLGARDYSTFWKAIVHGSALSLTHCEEALDLLADSHFHLGIEAGLPPNTQIAHKYGETLRPGEAQLRETAIVYLPNATYLLTVMLKGPGLDPLPGLLKEVSTTVYKEMSARKPA